MAAQKASATFIEIDRLATQLAKDPRSKVFLPLAEEYCKVGMWEEAISVLEDGLQSYPGFITAMVVLGRAYHQLNQPTKARAILEGAVKLSPDNLRAHRILIKIYAAQGLTGEALTSCQVILAVNPKDEEALSLQGSLSVPATDKAASLSAVTDQSRPIPSRPTENDADLSRLSSLPLLTPVTGVGSPGENRPTNDTSTIQVALTQEETSRQLTSIARLEAWLRLVSQRRLDRPATEVSDTNP